MVTLEGATAYHESRGNKGWISRNGQVALNQASDYIAAFYDIKPRLTTSEQSRLDTATYILALEFQTTPYSTRATAAIKEEKVVGEGQGEVDTTYFAPVSDSYPVVTAWLKPLTQSDDPNAFIIGRLSL